MRATAVRERIVNRLRQAEGRYVTLSELIEAVYYGEGRDNEPNWPSSTIMHAVHWLRDAGFPIQRRYNGYRYAGWIEVPKGARPYHPMMRIGDIVRGTARHVREAA